MSKREVELGIVFHHYDVVLCANHKYAKIKKSVSILSHGLISIMS